MATVSVGDKLDEEGTLAGRGPFPGPFGGLSDSEDVHTVNLAAYQLFVFRRDVVDLPGDRGSGRHG